MRKMLILIIASLLLLTTRAMAGININVEAIRKSVVFLYGTDKDGNVDLTKPLGTGFLVRVPLQSHPEQSYFLLVTARHIVDPEWAHCSSVNPSAIYVRLNKKEFDPAKDQSGTTELRMLLVRDNRRLWVTGSDDQVDAAIIPLTGSVVSAYDINAVPIQLFPTPEETKTFVVGDPIVSAGLIPGASGKKRNYPFFKFGNISSIPDENAEASCVTGGQTVSEHVWFIAANLVPGNSGSPIFFAPFGGGGITVGIGSRPMLLGVQSLSFIPFDIAGMTPIEYVYQAIADMKLGDADLRRGAVAATVPAPETLKK